MATKSNTITVVDIIGSPANYPPEWTTSGVYGNMLLVAEDGTSLLPDGAKDTFKLSRKANATPLLCLRSTDSGATWASFTPTFNTINEITLTDEPATNLVMIYYQTHTSMAVPVTNSEVLEVGKVYAQCNYYATDGNYLISNLIGKVPAGTSTSSSIIVDSASLDSINIRADQGNKFLLTSDTRVLKPSSRILSLTPYNLNTPACKVFPYLTRLNGKAYLNLVFKEMKHNGTSWGDDSKFNIVDNVSTTTDNNAQTILIGQKTVELPYFIAGDE